MLLGLVTCALLLSAQGAVAKMATSGGAGGACVLPAGVVREPSPTAARQSASCER